MREGVEPRRSGQRLEPVSGEPEWGVAARSCALRDDDATALSWPTSENGQFRPLNVHGVRWRREGEAVSMSYPQGV